jgi:hypothetical protein
VSGGCKRRYDELFAPATAGACGRWQRGRFARTQATKEPDLRTACQRVPINVGITQGASSWKSGLAGQEGGGFLFAWFLTAFFSTPEYQTPSSAMG